MQTEEPVWHYTQGHERGGPVDWPTLVGLARSGGIDPRGDMVWRPGMEDWKPAGQLDGLFERRVVAQEDGAYAELLPDVMPEGDRPRQVAVSSGVGRVEYVLGCGVLVPAVVLGGGWALRYFRQEVPGWAEKWGPLVLGVLGVVLVLHLTMLRLRNVGMSRLWLVGFVVPILNFWVGWRCLAAPSGYAKVRRLDAGGWVCSIVYAVGLMAGLVGGGMALWQGWRALEAEGGLEGLIQRAKENYETMDVRHKSQ